MTENNDPFYFDDLLQEEFKVRSNKPKVYEGNYSKMIIGTDTSQNFNAAGNFKIVANFPNGDYGNNPPAPNYLKDLISDKQNAVLSGTWIDIIYQLTKNKNWICNTILQKKDGRIIYGNKMASYYMDNYNAASTNKFIGMVETRDKDHINLIKITKIITHLSSKINDMIDYVLYHNISKPTVGFCELWASMFANINKVGDSYSIVPYDFALNTFMLNDLANYFNKDNEKYVDPQWLKIPTGLCVFPIKSSWQETKKYTPLQDASDDDEKATISFKHLWENSEQYSTIAIFPQVNKNIDLPKDFPLPKNPEKYENLITTNLYDSSNMYYMTGIKPAILDFTDAQLQDMSNTWFYYKDWITETGKKTKYIKVCKDWVKEDKITIPVDSVPCSLTKKLFGTDIRRTEGFLIKIGGYHPWKDHDFNFRYYYYWKQCPLGIIPIIAGISNNKSLFDESIKKYLEITRNRLKEQENALEVRKQFLKDYLKEDWDEKSLREAAEAILKNVEGGESENDELTDKTELVVKDQKYDKFVAEMVNIIKEEQDIEEFTKKIATPTTFKESIFKNPKTIETFEQNIASLTAKIASQLVPDWGGHFQTTNADEGDWDSGWYGKGTESTEKFFKSCLKKAFHKIFELEGFNFSHNSYMESVFNEAFQNVNFEVDFSEAKNESITQCAILTATIAAAVAAVIFIPFGIGAALAAAATATITALFIKKGHLEIDDLYSNSKDKFKINITNGYQVVPIYDTLTRYPLIRFRTKEYLGYNFGSDNLREKMNGNDSVDEILNKGEGLSSGEQFFAKQVLYKIKNDAEEVDENGCDDNGKPLDQFKERFVAKPYGGYESFTPLEFAFYNEEDYKDFHNFAHDISTYLLENSFNGDVMNKSPATLEMGTNDGSPDHPSVYKNMPYYSHNLGDKSWKSILSMKGIKKLVPYNEEQLKKVYYVTDAYNYKYQFYNQVAFKSLRSTGNKSIDWIYKRVSDPVDIDVENEVLLPYKTQYQINFCSKYMINKLLCELTSQHVVQQVIDDIRQILKTPEAKIALITHRLSRVFPTKILNNAINSVVGNTNNKNTGMLVLSEPAIGPPAIIRPDQNFTLEHKITYAHWSIENMFSDQQKYDDNENYGNSHVVSKVARLPLTKDQNRTDNYTENYLDKFYLELMSTHGDTLNYRIPPNAKSLYSLYNLQKDGDLNNYPLIYASESYKLSVDENGEANGISMQGIEPSNNLTEFDGGLDILTSGAKIVVKPDPISSVAQNAYASNVTTFVTVPTLVIWKQDEEFVYMYDSLNYEDDEMNNVRLINAKGQSIIEQNDFFGYSYTAVTDVTIGDTVIKSGTKLSNVYFNFKSGNTSGIVISGDIAVYKNTTTNKIDGTAVDVKIMGTTNKTLSGVTNLENVTIELKTVGKRIDNKSTENAIGGTISSKTLKNGNVTLTDGVAIFSEEVQLNDDTYKKAPNLFNAKIVVTGKFESPEDSKKTKEIKGLTLTSGVISKSVETIKINGEFSQANVIKAVSELVFAQSESNVIKVPANYIIINSGTVTVSGKWINGAIMTEGTIRVQDEETPAISSISKQQIAMNNLNVGYKFADNFSNVKYIYVTRPTAGTLDFTPKLMPNHTTVAGDKNDNNYKWIEIEYNDYKPFDYCCYTPDELSKKF